MKYTIEGHTTEFEIMGEVNEKGEVSVLDINENYIRTARFRDLKFVQKLTERTAELKEIYKEGTTWRLI